MTTLPAFTLTPAPHTFFPMTNPVKVDREGATMMTAAKGTQVTIDGKPYYDMLAGLGCVNIGYGNQSVCDAAYAAMQQLSYAQTFGGVGNPYNNRLSEKLVQLTGGDFTKFFYASTGSDANESAMKIALRYWRLRGQPERRVFISREHSYHGNTVMATSLTGIGHYHPQFGLPMTEMVKHAKTISAFWDGLTPAESTALALRSLEETILGAGASRVAAVFAEPVQTTGGMLVPPEGYLQGLQEICNRHDVLLIADEVVTGFGKTGHMFAYQHYDFQPDMLVMAKGLTSTYFPMSAVGLGPKMLATMNTDEAFEHGFTNCGHPVGSAVALANIAVIEDGKLVDHVTQVLAPIMARRLAQLKKHGVVGDVRHVGVLGGIDFNAGATVAEREAFCEKVSEAVYAKGVIARPLGSVLGLCLPLITTAQELETVFDRIDAAIASLG